MTLEIYNAATGAKLTGDQLSNLQAGADSDTLELEIWWNKGNDDGSIARNVGLLIRTQADDGRWLGRGLPPQDELWWRLRVTGQINTSSPAQQNRTFDWRPGGAYSVAELGDIHADCARLVEVKAHPPPWAQQTDYVWQVVPIYAEHAVPAPPRLAEVDRGVLTGVGERGRSGIVRGGALTVSDPADDQVHLAAVQWLHQGALHAQIQQDIQLDQADGDAAALAPGESYLAAITLGSGTHTVTKGSKDAAPTEPTPPAGEPVVRTVQVHYDAGGTSVITAGDLSGTTLYDRLAAEVDGLDVAIHPGRALGGGTYRWQEGSRTTLTVTDDATTWIWQTAAGLLEVTATAVPTEDTALPLYRATAAAGVITELVDLRPWAGKTRILRLAGSTGAAAGRVAERLVEAAQLYVDRAVYRLSATGGGTAGQHILEYQVGDATAYPGSATDDQRANFAFDAVELTDRDGIPEQLALVRGDVVSLDVVDVPTGTAAVDVELLLICREV